MNQVKQDEQQEDGVQPLMGTYKRSEGMPMGTRFPETLDHLRAIATSEAEKGRLFERLMKRYFTQDPLYRDRFSHVWLWSEWVAGRADFSGGDTGIDLVAAERDGGTCAIQCKCYAPGTTISKPHLDILYRRLGP